MNKKYFSKEHDQFLKLMRIKNLKIKVCQIGILILFIIFWELASKIGIIDSFLVSSPSRVWSTLVNLHQNSQLWNNVFATVLETVLGFVIGTALGILFAIIIWWSDFIFKVSEPYLVVLNALPKVALGPIVIIWMGSSIKAIIVMALLVSVIISTINILAGFRSVDKNKILLMKSFGANKLQILTKLVFPANIYVIISTLKINVGMSLIGVITGEFLVASKGIGYLIVYGGQVFKMDLVMAGIFALLIIAILIYFSVAWIESVCLKHRK